MLLPDINLWLAMTFVSHSHHPSAKTWFDSVPDGSCVFCRFTQQGFLRLATNAKVFGAQAVNLSDAWRLYDAYMNDPRVVFAAEPIDLEVHWRNYTQRPSVSPHLWGDAYLAAFARTADYEVVTFDKGLAQFKDLKCKVLT